MRRVVVVAAMLVACTSSEPSAITPGDTVVSIVDEPAGEHCPNGGSAVQSGVDDNGDGVLDTTEIDNVDYVCNAATTPTLVRQTAIAPGDVCPGGGTKVQTGRDLDRDGVLSDAEVEQTVTVCAKIEIWNGPLWTSSWTTPAQLETLANIRVVNGDVTIDSDGEMSKLELVAGKLSVSGGADVELPALRTIVGRVQQRSYTTTRLSLPILERVGGELDLESTAPNATISAPALSSVGGALTFGFSTVGDTIDLSALKDVSGDLYLSSNLADLSLNKLTTIAGSLLIPQRATTAAFPALKTIGAKLEVMSSNLTELSVPALESIGGDAYFTSLAKLTALRFESLQTVGGSLRLYPQTLETLDLKALTNVGRALTITNTRIPSLLLPKLRHIGQPAPDDTVSLHVGRNSALATVDLSSLVTIDGRMTLYDSDVLTKLELPALTTAEQVAVAECPAFTELRVPQLTKTMTIGLSELPRLSVADFPKLTEATASFILQTTGLTSLSGFSALEYTGYLDVDDDDALVDLHGLEKLTLASSVRFYGNANLVNLAGLDHLTRASGVFEIYDNSKLADLSGLSSLRYIGKNLLIRDNYALVSLGGLEQLATIQGALYLEYNEALASLAGLAGLTYIGGELELLGNTALPPSEVTAFAHRLGR